MFLYPDLCNCIGEAWKVRKEGGIVAVIGNPMTASADGKVNPECVRLISEMGLWPFKSPLNDG